MNPLRVTMVAPRFPPYRGGVETHTYEVGRRLAAEPGYQVSVITTDLDRGLPVSEQMEGMRVVRVPAWPRNRDWYWSPPAYRAVRDSRADVVHVQGYHTLVPPLAMAAARQARLPYVLTFHSGGHSSRLRSSIRPVQIRLLRPLLRAADRLVAVSRFEADLFSRALKVSDGRIVTIPNGADFSASSDTVMRRPALVLSVGRLERYKGHHRMIDAMPQVLAHVPDARLLILGDGPLESALRKRARRLGVAGLVEIRSVPREEVADNLRRASLVALLSEYESHGLAVHEALAVGTRVLVSDSSALAEVRDLPQAMALADDAPVSDVAAAIIAQLRASDTVPVPEVTLPTWDDCAEGLMRLYHEVAARRPPAREDLGPSSVASR